MLKKKQQQQLLNKKETMPDIGNLANYQGRDSEVDLGREPTIATSLNQPNLQNSKYLS